MKKMLFALKASIIEAEKYNTQEKALQYIVNNAMFTPINMDKEEGKQKKKEFTENVLNKDLYPHCRKKRKNIFYGFYDE